MRTTLIAATMIVIATGWTTATLGAPKAPPAGDNACGSWLAAYIANAERDHAAELPRWRYACEHQSDRLVCIDTQNAMSTFRDDVAPLKCGQRPAVSPSGSGHDGGHQAIATGEAEADNACANVMSAYVSHSESDFADKLPRWKSLCEHHPLKQRCDGTVDTLNTIRPDAPPLKCGL